MIKKTQNRTEKEYRLSEFLSSSDLRLFTLDRRAFFRKVVMREESREEESRSVFIGSLAHTLLLRPEEFDNIYFLSICPEKPTGLMLAFTEALYKHTIDSMGEDGQITKDFEEIARNAHADSGFKLSLEAVMKKFKDSSAELYYKELREAKTDNKTVVCVEDLSCAENIVNTLKTHEFTRHIFTAQDDDNHLIFNEYQVEDFTVQGLGMKAMIDKIIVNTEEKTIDIYDVKCVWDNINFYRDYYLKRRAYIQALVYYLAVKSSKLMDDFSEYTVNYPIFVACDSGNFYAPLQYPMYSQDMKNAERGWEENGRKYEGLSSIIEDLKWCNETGIWNISREHFENNGVASLK